jgi:hypothetical protein
VNDLFSQNLKIFLERYPAHESKFALENLNQFAPKNLEMRGDGDCRSLLENGKLLDAASLSFPKLEKNPNKKPARILLIEGFGLGYQLEYVLTSPLKDFDNLIVVEPSVQRFLFALQKISFEKYFQNQKIHFIVGVAAEESFSAFLQYLRVPEIAFRMDACQIIRHPVLSPQYSEYFEVVWDEWKAATRQTRLHFGTIQDSLLGLKYVVENLPWIKSNPGIISLKNKFKGIPAVIVSTGPSLNKSIEDLKQIQDKALILSADASLNILLDQGIEPHFVLSLERDLFSKKFFSRSSSQRKKLKTQLVSYPFVPQESLSTFRGEQWVAYRDLGYFLYFEHEFPRGILSSSTSVAHFCLRLANYLGCSSATLVGQDLAFDPDDFSSHADGVAYEEWAQSSSLEKLKERIEKEQLGHLLWVEGNFRPKVPTHSVYFSFMKEFSWEVSQLAMPVFNATEGGAKIPGVTWKNLAEVSKDWHPCDNLFEKIDSLREVRQGSDSLLETIPPFLTEICEKFKMILGLTHDLSGSAAMPDEKRRQTIDVLRSAQQELYKDSRFVCFVVQNAGRELVEIENAWATLPANADFAEKMDCLKRWTETTMNVAQQVADILTRAASEKKFKAVIS